MDFWGPVILTSIVLAIPVGIVVNLLTPGVQRIIDTRLQRSSLKRAATTEGFKKQASVFAEDLDGFNVYVTQQFFRTTFVGTLFGLVSGVAFAAAPTLDLAGQQAYRLIDLFNILGQLSALVGALAVLNIARSALRMMTAVRAAVQLRKADGETGAFEPSQ